MKSINKRLSNRFKSGLIYGLLSAATVSSGLAIEATPEDNVDLRNQMSFLTGALDTFIVAGLIPFDPVSRPGEIGEFATNLSLKAISPALYIPEDKFLLPNSADGCSRDFNLPQTQDQYDNWFGFWAVTPLETNWGDLGTPSVYHANTSVSLSVQISGDTDISPSEVSLREGRHSAYWQADTLISPFWDYVLPLYLMLPNASAEAKYGEALAKKIAKAPAKKASKIKKALAQAGERIAKTAGLKTASFLSSGIFNDSQTTVSNGASQSITIYDVHTPRIETTSPELVVEARNFGGSFFSRVKPELLETITYYDECNRPVTLQVEAPSFLPFGKSTITWTVSDGEYYHPDVEPTSSISQVVDVQDTQAPILVPPAGFAVYSDDEIKLEEDDLFFGAPLVADLADPTPTVTRDTPDSLLPGFRYFVNYTATDDSGNSTDAPSNNPNQYSQIVTVKRTGTNTSPIAMEKQTETITSSAVAITLEGIDLDDLPFANVDKSSVDPLAFLVVDRPKFGEFVAPLYPYFIEDFRPQPEDITSEEIDYRTLSCPADLTDAGALEAKLGLLERFVHDDYVEKCYCNRAGAPVPQGFIYEPRYIHITDENEYFVSDSSWSCNNDPSGTTDPRIAKFKDGELLRQRVGEEAGEGGVFQVDDDKNLWWTNVKGQGGSREAVVLGLDSNLSLFGSKPAGAKFGFSSLKDSGELFNIDTNNLQNTHVDAKNKVIYVNDKSRIYMFDYDDPTIYYGAIRQGDDFLKQCVGSGGFWMDTDSEGNLYQVCMSKIHKIAPPIIANGSKTPGDYVGWLGKCDANKLDPETQVPYNYCNEETQSSRGFQCTDETCESSNDFTERFGSLPGQFSRARHIDIDPNDILYVVDYDNSRIQRFSPDGTYAGEAKSTGDGVATDGSFVLGNMGKPRHVSVNSTEFHVLESNSNNSDYFLHIFKTLPFYDLTDSSAKVDYISDLNFQGTDRFSYLVDDGIDISEPAQVSIKVERAFRAPENLQAICFTDESFAKTTSCQVDEDQALFVRLSADDLDGFIGFGGLDRLSFSIEDSVKNGAIELLDKQVSFQNLVYRPARDYFGPDTFSFQVNDGKSSAEHSFHVEVQVNPVSDPVKIHFPDNIDVARGFDESFRFEFEDVDKDSFPQPEIVSIDWGDGVIATEKNGWQGVGIKDENDDPVYPQYNTSAGNGMIIAAHSFDSSVAGIEICMRDGEEGIVCQSSLSVSAQNSTNVSINRMDDSMLEPNQDFVLKLQLINQKPDYWSGFSADDVEFSLQLAEGLNIKSIDSRCSGSTNISCVIGKLDVEQQTNVEIVLNTTPTQAQQNQLYTMDIALTDAGPRMEDVSHTFTSISVADDDSDDTINYYDAFPLDARYISDSDKDGIADRFEEKYGLNALLASDANSDADGDGASALVEFLNDSSPYMPDAFYQTNRLKLPELESTSYDDSFGTTLSSGDINGDGFDDVIAGAPGYDIGGGAFVFYGNAQGVGEAIRLMPQSLSENDDFGFKVAVGDLNEDGLDDIAVSSSQGIHLFWGNRTSISTSDIVIPPPLSDGMTGQAVLIQDANGDDKADLIFTSKFYDSGFGPTGAIHIYLGSLQFWLSDNPIPDLTLTNTEYFNMGDSLAIGDLDGDTLPDFVTGSAYESGVVLGYYGKSIDWQFRFIEFADFEILDDPADRFAYALSVDMDWDGDAKSDLFVGSYFSDTLGDVRIYKSSENFRSNNLIRVNGKVENAQFGSELSVLAPSRFITERSIAIGTPRESIGEEVNNGSITFLTGSELDSTVLTLYGKEHEMLGVAFDASADINNDGVMDIIAGAPELTTDSHRFNTGQVYIYLGGQAAKQSDEDADEVGDDIDNCLNMTNSDQLNTDNDNFGNVCDADDDNDGVLDAADAFPLDASESVDTDGDGIGNNADTDDDGDGVADVDDAYPLDPTRTRDDSAVVSKDVNGDGMADILWRNQSDGRNWMWTMDGRSILTSAGINTIADPAWQIVGRGDFDGDGKSDVLWRNSETGRNWVYLMDGFTIRSSQQLNYVTDNNWHVKGVGDFDGDGKDDVIWRHAVRGDTWVYLMNGTQIRVSQGSRKVSDLNWKIVAVGDVDGDSQDDVIWRHATRGDNYIWLMNGVQLSSGYVLNRISTTWEITGAGDLNGDGTDDILWRNKVDGRNWGYLMNGGQIQTSQLINTVSSQDWQMADILDLDGDGKVDIFWRNNNDGRSYIFLMNGLSITSQGFSTSVSNNWQVSD